MAPQPRRTSASGTAPNDKRKPWPNWKPCDAKIAELQAARVIALDIIPGAVPMETYHFPKRCLMLFGAEGPGLSEKALELADDVVYISQFGSVRSINAGAAAAVSMHAWIAQHATPPVLTGSYRHSARLAVHVIGEIFAGARRLLRLEPSRLGCEWGTK